MSTVAILQQHVQTLPEQIKFGNHPLYNAINIRTLTSDLGNFDSLHAWIKNKNMPDHLRKEIIKAILSTNPPEPVKVDLLIHSL